HGLAMVRGHPVDHAPAGGARIGEQGHYPAGRLGRAAMIDRRLPEAPRIPLDISRLPLRVRKRGPPHQGAVAEDPEIIAHETMIPGLAGAYGISAHDIWSRGRTSW